MNITKGINQVLTYLIFVILISITIFLYILNTQINELKQTFLQDSKLKALQIQRLDAGIDFQNKKQQFITLARDSIIMQNNKKIKHEEAYDIAEFNLYISEKYKLDPILLLAIQQQESAFNKKALSDAGAIGLNQIFPMTGRLLSSIMGIEYSANLLYDPKVNTEMAAVYLTYLKAEYPILDYILVGYNAGPRWIYYHKTQKHELPEETKNYIVKVREFYDQFDKKLAVYLPGNTMKIVEEVDTIHIDLTEKDSVETDSITIEGY